VKKIDLNFDRKCEKETILASALKNFINYFEISSNLVTLNLYGAIVITFSVAPFHYKVAHKFWRLFLCHHLASEIKQWRNLDALG